jgi:hypothetical protein
VAQYFDGLDAEGMRKASAALAGAFPFKDQFDGLVLLATRK